MDTSKYWIKKNSDKIVLSIIILQPFLDIISFFMVKVDRTIITTLFRMFIFGLITFMGFVCSDRKKAYFSVFSGLAIFEIVHIVICYKNGYISFFSDFSMFLRTIQMPIFILCFITFFKNIKDVPLLIGKGFWINYIIISSSIFISVLLGKPEFTYYPTIGIKGWFTTGNAQSCIISIMAMFALYYVYKTKNSIWFLISEIVIFSNMFYFGTRVSYFSIFIISVFFIIFLLWNREKKYFVYIFLVLGCIICALNYKVSPCYINQYNTKEAFAGWDDKIMGVEKKILPEEKELPEEVNKSISDEDKQKKNINEITNNDKNINIIENQYKEYNDIYNLYLSDVVDRFGIEKVVKEYNYSKEADIIINARTKKINFCNMLMDEMPFLNKLFGFEYQEMIYRDTIYDPENDFPAIYYLYGYIGILMYILVLVSIILILIIDGIKNIKKPPLELGITGISLVLIIGIAQLSGNVLRRPNVSIYLSLFLACAIWIHNNLTSHHKR